MWIDYYFYLMILPEVERTKQIIIIVCIWINMFIIGIIVGIVKKIINNNPTNFFFIISPYLPLQYTKKMKKCKMEEKENIIFVF